jgi:hypothetical protein
MAGQLPVTELHAGFSSAGASPTDWAEGRRLIEAAQVFWLTTVRPDGRPHVTLLLTAWRNDAIYFCTVRTSARRRTSSKTRGAQVGVA